MKDKNEEQYFTQSGKYMLYHTLLNELNEHPIKTNRTDNIQYYHNICEKFESIKSDYIDRMINLQELKIITDAAFNATLEPLIPKCNFDSKTGIFTMDFNFVPYLKIDYLKKFVKIKNALMYLIMESINQIEMKPRYEEPILIIFSISKKFLFDVDNIEIKYIIDSLRYSHFFADDSYNYISYMVEGNETKKHPSMTVTIIKKSDLKYTI